MKASATLLLLLALSATTARADVTIAAVGDNLFGRYKDDTKKYLPVVSDKDGDPYELVASSLQGADLTFGNLETPAMDPPKEFSTYRSLTFRADPSKLALMAAAGFDVLSIANNHMNNMGYTAPAATRKNIEAAGLRAVGAGASEAEAYRPTMMVVNGKRCAFLAFTVIINGGLTTTKLGAIAYVEPKNLVKKVVPLVIAARRYLGAEYVFVSLHWGQESADHPDSEQRKEARAIIDAGADVILGSHPHVLQDVERWHGGLIIYSMGNFLFDAFQLSWRQTMIVHAELDGEGVERHVGDVTLEPISIGVKIHKPAPASGKEYQAIEKKLKSLAKGFTLTPEP
jgi:poly-gamma-glutamate synthesis protein (capsule biosynthesis protein)